MPAPIEIDGSFGEGGGQILRTSLALSLITGKAFHLRNIRARRPKPGLQPQHLMSVRAAATVGQANLRGASKDSCDLLFEPGTVKSGAYRFDIGTAGATGLVLHTVYLPLALRGTGPSELTLTGGTHVKTSPTFHFLDATWRRYLALIGLSVDLRLVRPGFYPRGGGCIEATIQPARQLRGVRLLERGPVRVAAVAAVAGLQTGIAERMARRLAHRLGHHGVETETSVEMWDGGPGAVLITSLDTTPAPTVFVALGERGKPAERVADDAVEEVGAYLTAGPALVDPHSADQLVLPLALAEGPSEYRTTAISRHLTTNIAVINKFLEREIHCEGEEGSPGTVRIE